MMPPLWFAGPCAIAGSLAGMDQVFRGRTWLGIVLILWPFCRTTAYLSFAVSVWYFNGGDRWLRKTRAKAKASLTEIQEAAVRRDVVEAQ